MGAKYYRLEAYKYGYENGSCIKNKININIIKKGKRAIKKQLKDMVKARTIEYTLQYNYKGISGFANNEGNYGFIMLEQDGNKTLLEEYIVTEM